MHNELKPTQPLRLRYDENWDFAARASMSSKGANGKNTLLQITQEYEKSSYNNNSREIARHHRSDTSDGSDVEDKESNLQEEMMRVSLSDTRSVSSGSRKSSRAMSSAASKRVQHHKAKQHKVYSPYENETQDGYSSEYGLADERLPPHGKRRTSRINTDKQSDIHSMYSVQSAASGAASSYQSSKHDRSMRAEQGTTNWPREDEFHRRRTGNLDTSIGENLFDDSGSIGEVSNYTDFMGDTNDSWKRHAKGSRKHSRHTSLTGSGINSNSGYAHSTGTSPRESIVRTTIPEISVSEIPVNSTPIAANGSVHTSRLSPENRSVISVKSRDSRSSRRHSEQLQGRLSKAETDSIGSASSIMMRPLSRMTRSSGSKSMNATDPDDEILVGPEKTLHDAARRGDAAAVEQLLNDGVYIDCRNQTERTPLHLAAGNGHIPVLKLMLDRDASTEASDKFGMNALLWAAWFGHKEAARLLLRAGAKPTSRNKNGYTFLHCAAQNNHLMVEEILLEDLEDFDKDTPDDAGRTCLHVLAKYGRKIMLERFIDLNCNVNARDKEGNTPLHLAAKYGFGILIPVLVKAGADIEIENSVKKTPLHLAAEEGQVEAVAALVAEEADANAETEDEVCPLHLAIAGGHEEAAIALINGSADLDAGDKHNQTPLHYAVLKRQSSLARLLILHNANPNVQDARQESPLHLAAENGQPDITEMLLQSNVDLTLKDQRGKTPLDVAARGSFTTIVDMIIKAERHQMQRNEMNIQMYGSNEYETEFTPVESTNISFKPDNSPETQHMRTLLFKLATKHLKRDDWRRLAFHWSFTDSQVCAIEEQYTGDKSFREHGHRMLLIWLNGCLLHGQNPTKLLFEGLVAIKRQELAELMRTKANSIATEKSCTIS